MSNNNTRGWAKQEIKRAIGNLDWVEQHLSVVGEKYQEYHPDITLYLIELLELIQNIKKSLNDFMANL